MVIGNGILAKEFCNYNTDEKVLVFASGVSNSKETSKVAFEREEKLLNEYLDKFSNSMHILYFSTCSMYDTYIEMSEYTKHKIKMENIIINRASKYNIFRLPQVLGLNNKHQLIGYFFNVIKNGEPFNLLNIERNIIDINDVYLLVKHILKESNYRNTIQNIANPHNIKVIDLVHLIEKVSNHKATYNIVEKLGSFSIDTSNINFLIDEYDIFGKNYLEDRIRKYYA